MAKKPQEQDQTTTPDSAPSPAPTQPDPGLLAELDRLRAENARLEAAAIAQATSSAEAAPGEGPQGIVIRFMESGDERKDFHPKFREKRMIDPESLKVNGIDPYLALPIVGTNQVRIRRIAADHAAYILTCDPASGGQSVYRLATNEEVEAQEADNERRRAPAERSRAKDLRNAE